MLTLQCQCTFYIEEFRLMPQVGLCWEEGDIEPHVKHVLNFPLLQTFNLIKFDDQVNTNMYTDHKSEAPIPQIEELQKALKSETDDGTMIIETKSLGKRLKKIRMHKSTKLKPRTKTQDTWSPVTIAMIVITAAWNIGLTIAICHLCQGRRQGKVTTAILTAPMTQALTIQSEEQDIGSDEVMQGTDIESIGHYMTVLIALALLILMVQAMMTIYRMCKKAFARRFKEWPEIVEAPILNANTDIFLTIHGKYVCICI